MAKKRQKRAQRQLRRERAGTPHYAARRGFVLTLLSLMAMVFIGGAAYRTTVEVGFLRQEGDRRHLRVQEIPAHRGIITDRRGDPLAVSAPVESVAANPRRLQAGPAVLAELARALEIPPAELAAQLADQADRSFIYLRRRVAPAVAERVRQLIRQHKLEGLDLLREYRRFYPSGEVFAHVLGFTDIDDIGQEGLELSYENHLRGEPGRKRVIKDGAANVIDVDHLAAPRSGKDLVLSLDRRLQHLAYRELKEAVIRHRAVSGSLALLDVQTGEVLALVNQPAFNPNGDREDLGARLRNRAVIDRFEPGSAMKPFTVALALERGLITPDTLLDTAPGWMMVGRHTVRDHRNYGLIDVRAVLRKSSNVGISQIALEIPPQELWSFLAALGLDEAPGTAFPNETAGYLPHYLDWAKISHATLSFGYGLAVSPMQLARAYSALANDGMIYPVSLLKQSEPVGGRRVLSPETAIQVRRMLEDVVSAEGTASLAAVPGYRVAGKTGTVKKSVPGGYAEDRHMAVFAGLAPASAPRFAMVVMVDEPRGDQYYGGEVAAPVFAKVMQGALRFWNIAPDATDHHEIQLAALGEVR